MTYRELAEMIEVLLTEKQKDQEVVYVHSEYGVCHLYDLKISNHKYVDVDYDGRKQIYPAKTAYLSGMQYSETIDEMENG